MLTLALLVLSAVQLPTNVELDVTPGGAVVLIETEDSLWIVGESTIDIVEPCEPALPVAYGDPQ